MKLIERNGRAERLNNLQLRKGLLGNRKTPIFEALKTYTIRKISYSCLFLLNFMGNKCFF